MIDLLTFFKELDIHNIEIFEPLISSNSFMGYDINNSLIDFKNGVDIIITNRFSNELIDVKDKVYTRDVFNSN